MTVRLETRVLAVDVGGSHISAGLATGSSFELLKEVRRSPHEPVGSIPDFVSEVLGSLGDNRPQQVALAIAGVVDPTLRYLVSSENLGNVPSNLAELLEAETGLMTTLETDVFCLGKAIGYDSPIGTFLVVGIGTGIGHCVVINGQVRAGRSRYGNRFGHVRVDFTEDVLPCYCGNSGCVCQYAAGSNLYENSKTEGGRDLAHKYLARALGTAVQVLAPDEVLLTGGPVTAGVFSGERLSDQMRDSCEEWLIPPIRFVNDTSAIYRGAALTALERLQ